jgi:hypothetical protein
LVGKWAGFELGLWLCAVNYRCFNGFHRWVLLPSYSFANLMLRICENPNQYLL